MKRISTIIASSLFVFAIFSNSAYAAKCKGMSESACSNALDCGWVKQCTRKDGATVKGHCRTNKKAAKAAKKAKKQDAKAAMKKAKDKTMKDKM